LNAVIVGPFGMRPRSTMRVRALPMAKALAARGHRVTMLLPPWQNPEDAGQRWEEDGVVVESIRLSPQVTGLLQGFSALRLARRALALRPDVVHLFKPKAYSGLTHSLLALLPRGRRPRLVVDTDDWEGPGGWNELGDYTSLQRRFFARQERWGLTHADAVTVASRTLESLVWAMGVPRSRVFYVPNGVGEDLGVSVGNKIVDQKPGGSSDPASANWILLYTRFFEFPVSRVIDVLGRVRERVPGARLLVVGEGLFGEEEDLFRLAAQSGLTVSKPPAEDGQSPPALRASILRSSSDIAYVGWVASDELPFYFSQAAVAIYPFEDTLINRTKCAVKLRDLLAAGVPVVAEAVGQNQEYIRDGQTGLLVKPGDVATFGDAVARVLQTPALRDRLGQAAARDIRERFAWEKLVGVVEEAYRVRR